MQSTSPPPPPPYASKHTIIAAPPAVSNRLPLSPTTTGKVLPPDPTSPGHRVSTALNITFSSPPPIETNQREVIFGDSSIRRHTVQRVMNQPPLSSSQLNSGSSSSVNSATSGSNPATDWKYGEFV